MLAVSSQSFKLLLHWSNNKHVKGNGDQMCHKLHRQREILRYDTDYRTYNGDLVHFILFFMKYLNIDIHLWHLSCPSTAACEWVVLIWWETSVYLQTCQRSALPIKAFNPARKHSEGQLGVSQRLLIFLHFFKTEGTVAKQPTKQKTTNHEKTRDFMFHQHWTRSVNWHRIEREKWLTCTL